MNLSPLEQINNIQTAQKQQSPDAMRRAAVQFEAVLLMQLTSALNNTSEPDEDALFGSDGGSGLAKQMFSEQLATTMSQSGGIGLADLIMQKFGAAQTKPVSGNIKGLSNAISAVKDIKESVSTQKTSQKNVSPLINKSAKFVLPAEELFTGNSDEAQIISRFEDQIETEEIDDSDANLMLAGKTQNSKGERIVPYGAVMKVETVSTGMTVGSTLNTSNKVDFQMPLSGRVSSGFGNRFHPIDKKIKFHAGVDLAVPVGTRVAAAAEGIVKFAGWKGGYGNLVIIEHADGRETRYGHLSKIMVSEGEKVSLGQQIALSGSTGKSTGPHLHFEIRENGQVVDPIKFLSNVLPKNAER
jgi:murein DD-endopeptidase MepM/ murein hydrolase activator NlpD